MLLTLYIYSIEFSLIYYFNKIKNNMSPTDTMPNSRVDYAVVRCLLHFLLFSDSLFHSYNTIFAKYI